MTPPVHLPKGLEGWSAEVFETRPRARVRVPAHGPQNLLLVSHPYAEMTPENQSQDTQLSAIAQALGRIPSGLFIVTTTGSSGTTGFVASFVQQVGFDPPTIAIAVNRERGPLQAIRENGRFSLSLLDKSSSGLMGRFFSKLKDGETPFDGQPIHTTAAGSSVFSDALAWYDCKLLENGYDNGDHHVLFGVVEEADLSHEGDPLIHLRKNGLDY